MRYTFDIYNIRNSISEKNLNNQYAIFLLQRYCSEFTIIKSKNDLGEIIL